MGKPPKSRISPARKSDVFETATNWWRGFSKRRKIPAFIIRVLWAILGGGAGMWAYVKSLANAGGIMLTVFNILMVIIILAFIMKFLNARREKVQFDIFPWLFIFGFMLTLIGCEIQEKISKKSSTQIPSAINATPAPAIAAPATNSQPPPAVAKTDTRTLTVSSNDSRDAVVGNGNNNNTLIHAETGGAISMAPLLTIAGPNAGNASVVNNSPNAVVNQNISPVPQPEIWHQTLMFENVNTNGVFKTEIEFVVGNPTDKTRIAFSPSPDSGYLQSEVVGLSHSGILTIAGKDSLGNFTSHSGRANKFYVDILTSKEANQSDFNPYLTNAP